MNRILSLVDPPGPTSTAVEMRRQRDAADGYAYNLDLMYRKAGSPEDKAPLHWSRLARPYLKGVASYLGNLDGFHGHGALLSGFDPEDLTTILFEGGDSLPWPGSKPGDLLGTHFVAYAYAAFLDGEDAKG